MMSMWLLAACALGSGRRALAALPTLTALPSLGSSCLPGLALCPIFLPWRWLLLCRTGTRA